MSKKALEIEAATPPLPSQDVTPVPVFALEEGLVSTGTGNGSGSGTMMTAAPQAPTAGTATSPAILRSGPLVMLGNAGATSASSDHQVVGGMQSSSPSHSSNNQPAASAAAIQIPPSPSNGNGSGSGSGADSVAPNAVCAKCGDDSYTKRDQLVHCCCCDRSFQYVTFCYEYHSNS